MSGEEDNMIEAPKPGIYQDVPRDDYHAWRIMSNSVIKHGATKTMAHMKSAWDGVQKPSTQAMKFGEAFHTRLLEPERFKAEYADAEPCAGQTQKGQPCSRLGTERYAGIWYCQQHQPDEQPDNVRRLTPSDRESIEGMGAAVYAHKAVKLLRAAGGHEVSVVAQEPTTGLMVKGRFDKLIREYNGVPIILDLKSVASNEIWDLERQVLDNNLHVQAALYRDMYLWLTGEKAVWLWAFCEKTPPYTVRIEPIGQASLHVGRCVYQRTLAAWAECLESGVYPAYGTDIGDGIDIPQWAIKREEQYMEIIA